MIIKKPSGEKVMILNLSIRKVCPMNHIMKIYSLRKVCLVKKTIMEIHSLTKTILRIDCLCLKGEPDNVEEAERREGDNDNLSDSEGKPHESYHGDS